MGRRAVQSRVRDVERASDRRPTPAAVPQASALASVWVARAPLIAALVALVVYLPSLAGGFLYDDVHVVVDNRRIQDFTALATVLRYEPARPLLNLTWAVNYALSGLTPWPYHLVNVLIHAGNAALVASLFLWIARRSAGRVPAQSALVSACLFAATPMAAETVAYVASRSTALAALFSLATLRLAVDALAGGSRRRLAAALTLFVVALATKEEAAAVPVLLVLLDYFFIAGRSPRELRRRGWTYALFFALPVLGLAARRWATGAWLPASVIDRGLYLLTQWAAFPLYVFRALLPFDPAFYRDHPLAAWPPAPATVAWGLLTLIVAVSAVFFRWRFSLWSFAVAWMAAGLLPSSSLVPLGEMVVDHRAYLGGAGVLLWAGDQIWRRGGRGLVAIVLVLFTVRAWQYQWVLADPVRAWEDAVRQAPRSPDAYRALADAYAGRGDPRAMIALTTAVRLEPRDGRSWANLGVLYAQSGRLNDAAEAMKQAAALMPGDARIHDNLGFILQAIGREKEAAAAYEAAIATGAPLAQPRIRLAALLIKNGQRERARALLDEAARLGIDPEDAAAVESLRAQLR
jgi:tetratricopeptide (TPR) repeat protein